MVGAIKVNNVRYLTEVYKRGGGQFRLTVYGPRVMENDSVTLLYGWMPLTSAWVDLTPLIYDLMEDTGHDECGVRDAIELAADITWSFE